MYFRVTLMKAIYYCVLACVKTLQTCTTGCNFAVDIYAQRVDGELLPFVHYLVQRCITLTRYLHRRTVRKTVPWTIRWCR